MPGITKPVKIYDKVWEFTLTPSAEFLKKERSIFPLVVFFCGILVAFLSTLGLRFLLLSQLRLQLLRVAKGQAEESAAFKSQFLANMSHEIRTPLTGILGYAESLKTDTFSQEEQNLAIEVIMKNGEHLLGVINDILDFSKIEAGKLEVEEVNIEIVNVIQEVSNLMQLKTQEKGLSLGFEYEYPIPRYIKSDPTRLKQILINLIGNAIKFTSVGGVKVNVIFLKEVHKLSFQVIDTGTGISDTEIAKLFKAFSQADSSTTRKFGGSGLGLLISRELAHKLGGDISVESKPGKGSVFTVTISTGNLDEIELLNNIQKGYPSLIPVEKDLIPQLQGRILVAEDGPDNQNLISFLLKKTQVNFKIVDNGALALEEITKNEFDLVLMDAQMPVMDGYTATKKIRELGITIPIVALTANAMKADVEKAYSFGCSDFLGKPFTRKQFFSKLANILKTTSNSVNTSQTFSENGTITLIKEDPEMLELILQVISNLPSRADEISNAIKDSNWEEIARLAHTLRGISANLGFMSLSKTAGIIEKSAQTEDKQVIVSQFDMLKLKIYEAQKSVTELKLLVT